MLVGREYGGNTRLTTTVQGHSHDPLHRGFQQSGCIEALLRLVAILKVEHGGTAFRFVKNIPTWLTDTSFEHACARTTIRDAEEYARRFRRLRRTLQTGEFEDIAPAEPSFARIHRAVAAARIAFGSALEVVASASAARICDAAQLPADPADTARLAWLCYDAYLAALWTDAHVNYLLDVLDEDAAVHQLSGEHVHLGAPCIAQTVSVSTLPNVAAKFEQFCANANHIDDESKHLMSVLFRCGQSGSRGWDSALKASLTSVGSQRVLHTAFKACLVGMHPQLHPSARPDWTQRALIVRLFDELSPASMNELLSSCGTCTKESIRIYMCSILNEIPATRSGLARVQNSVGLLRSAPSGLVPVSLAAAAQNIVAAGLDAGEALSMNQDGDESSVVEKVKAAIQNRIGNEPRIRSRCVLQPRQSAKTTPTIAGAPRKAMYAVSYNPSWFGRVAADEEDASLVVGNGSLNGLSILHEVCARAFRSSFVPFWVHGHGHGVRTSRFDESQHAHMLKSSSLHAVLCSLDETTTLRVQRVALRWPLSSTATIAQIGLALRLDAANQSILNEAKTFEEAILAVCSLSAEAGAKLIVFARITTLKNKFLSYSLGPTMYKRQLDALRKRFEIPAALTDAEAAERLPDHATKLFFCLECKRIPNAAVDDRTRMNSHNEVGLAQTMLRVGGPDEAYEIRCARRSSAALRTAMQKEEDALRNRVECMEVTNESLTRALRDNGDVSHAARLRRDLRTCAEQHEKALACGDRALVRVSLIGKAVRVNGRFYTICSFCASVVQISHLRRFQGDICCCRCDASMVNGQSVTSSQATRVAVEVDTTSVRTPPSVLRSIVPDEKLHCRYCNKAPPSSATAAKFRILRAPSDCHGRNSALPPPLRCIALCAAHYKPWVENALLIMPIGVVFAHISEKATPVYGADANRPLAIEFKRPNGTPRKQKLLKRRGKINNRSTTNP